MSKFNRSFAGATMMRWDARRLKREASGLVAKAIRLGVVPEVLCVDLDKAAWLPCWTSTELRSDVVREAERKYYSRKNLRVVPAVSLEMLNSIDFLKRHLIQGAKFSFGLRSELPLGVVIGHFHGDIIAHEVDEWTREAFITFYVLESWDQGADAQFHATI